VPGAISSEGISRPFYLKKTFARTVPLLSPYPETM
jgi:hypothetical protein